MPRVALLFLLALVQLVVGSAPTFFWSNQDLFGKNIESLQIMSFDEIKSGLFGEAQDSPLKTVSKNLPEVVITFVQPALTNEKFTVLADEDAFKSLEFAIESSKSSYTVAYTNEAQFASQFASQFGNKFQTASVIMATEAGAAPVVQSSFLPEEYSVQRMTIKTLQQKLEAGNWDILHNQQTDLIVVLFDSNQEAKIVSKHSEAIRKMVGALDATSYLAIYGTEVVKTETNTISVEKSKQAEIKREYHTRSFQQIEQTVTTNYWPDNVVEGLILTVPLLIIVYIGITCTFSIQSGLKFEAGKSRQKFGH